MNGLSFKKTLIHEEKTAPFQDCTKGVIMNHSSWGFFFNNLYIYNLHSLQSVQSLFGKNINKINFFHFIS